MNKNIHQLKLDNFHNPLAKQKITPKTLDYISKNRENTEVYCEIRNSQNPPTEKTQFRSRDLESFDSVRKLADHLFDFEYGSRVSLDTCIANLCKLCNFVRMSPDEIILLDHESLQKHLKALYESMVRKGLSLKYARTTTQGVKTFLKCNGIDLKFKLPKIPPRYQKRGRYVPTPKEVKKMMDHAGSLKNAAIVGFLGFSGLRNSTLRALQYGKCPDPKFPHYSIKHQLEKGEKVLVIVVHPEMKRIVKSACKGKIPYFTFIPEFVTEKLKAYLNSKYAREGKLDDDALLFPTSDRRILAEERPLTPMSKRAIENIVKQAARYADLPQWKLVTPQSLRISFKMWLVNQPEAVRLPFEDREFVMGHIPAGTIDPYYEARIEDLKQKFSKLVLSESDYNRDILQAMCTMLGIDFNVEYQELTKKFGREPSLSEMGEIIKRKLRPKQIPVSMKDVPKYLNDDWRWVAKLDDETAILEKTF